MVVGVRRSVGIELGDEDGPTMDGASLVEGLGHFEGLALGITLGSSVNGFIGKRLGHALDAMLGVSLPVGGDEESRLDAGALLGPRLDEMLEAELGAALVGATKGRLGLELSVGMDVRLELGCALTPALGELLGRDGWPVVGTL